MFKNENRLWHFSLAATLSLLVPFNLVASLGMDIYLPVVPVMPIALDTTPAVIQITLTAYMILLGVGQLVFGPISDRIGRRPILLIGITLFVLTTLGLGSVSTAAPFVALRCMQALGAAAMLVAIFATIRDVYAGTPESGSIYGFMNAMLSFVPALGPVAGALIAELLDWRWIFNLLAGVALVAAVFVVPFWRETRRQSDPGSKSDIRQILHSRAFWAFTTAFGTAMGTFFVFFSTAPRILITRAGMSEVNFSLAFATVAIVMIFTSRFVGRLVKRWGIVGCAYRGMGLMVVGAGLLLLGHFFLSPSVVALILPMWVVAVGIVLIGAVTANGALAEFGDAAGLAVALHFCVQSLIVGLVGTAFIVNLDGDTVFPLVAYIAVMTGLSVTWISLTRSPEI